MSTPEMQQIIQRAQQRDPEAVTQLYQLYCQPIYRYIAYRVPTTADAEDLTAEVFVKMIEGLPKYRQTGVPFEAWLYRIAAARVIDYRRRQMRRPQTSLSETMHNGHTLPEERLQEQQEFERLRQALAQLSDEQQSLLILRFIERKTHQEVAAILGKSEAAVKSIQHRALAQLTALLGSAEKVRHYLRGRHG
jgi:RNA polymerase sigma-70 factor (ECF subfamily)